MKLKLNVVWYTKNNSGYLKDPEIRIECDQYIEENIGRYLHDIDLRNVFNNLTPVAKITKTKVKRNGTVLN